MTRSTISETQRSGVVVRIAPLSLAGLREHGSYLLPDHAREAEPELAARLDPNWEAYEQAEAQEQLIVLGAWVRGDTVKCLIGYAVAVVVDSAHYRDYCFVQHDALYVDPGWRRAGVGLRLIRALRTEAHARGATHLLMHAKPGSALERILPRLGFLVEETVFKGDSICPKQ